MGDTVVVGGIPFDAGAAASPAARTAPVTPIEVKARAIASARACRGMLESPDLGADIGILRKRAGRSGSAPARLFERYYPGKRGVLNAERDG